MNKIRLVSPINIINYRTMPMAINPAKFYMLMLAAISSLLFTACLKEDEPVTPHQPGSSVTSSFNLGTNYRYQGYFNLETNTFVGQNLKTAWDMGFDTRPGKYAIVLNGAKFCKVWNTGIANMTLVQDTVGANWAFDTNTGNLDTTGVGAWGVAGNDTMVTNGNVYVVDRGYDENNTFLGFKKFKIDGAGKNLYYIQFANLDGTEPHTLVVPKNSIYNFTFATLTGAGALVDAEPPANTWDICFTQYIYVYNTVDYPNYPYLVAGVLLNHNYVTTAADSTTAYEDIALADTLTNNFTQRRDIIGYDWKGYSFTTAQYTIKPGKNYIIRSRNGLYYKFHFLDFYKDGLKGNVAFEYQLL